MAITMPTFRKSVGSVAMTATYNTLLYDYFPLVPVHYRPIYWDARYSMEWASGKVSYEHNKLLSSGIGMTVVETLAKRIVGGELLFKKGSETDQAKETTDKVKVICNKRLKLNDKINSTALKFLASGSSYLVLQQVGEHLRLESLNLDQVAPSFAGDEVVSAKIFINYYDNAHDGIYGGARYYLIENRYYNEENKPCSINKVFKSVLPQMQGSTETFDFTWRDGGDEADEIDLEKGLPAHIRNKIEQDGIVLGVETKLPFSTIGIYHFKNTSHDLRHPNSKFGRPLLSGTYDLLWAYDFAFSILNKDLYVGRPISFIPSMMNGNLMMSQQMGDSQVGNLYYQMKLEYPSLFDDEFVKIPNTDGSYQQPSTVQFDIRSDKLKVAMDDIASKIAHNVGITPSYLISVLNQQNETKTATEVASDVSETNLTILDKRRLMQDALNDLIDEVARFYNFDSEDVFVTFPPLEELNKTLTADITVKLRSVNAMSVERAVELNCKDYSEAEKQEEIERIKQELVSKNESKIKEKGEVLDENSSIEPSNRDKE